MGRGMGDGVGYGHRWCRALILLPAQRPALDLPEFAERLLAVIDDGRRTANIQARVCPPRS